MPSKPSLSLLKLVARILVSFAGTSSTLCALNTANARAFERIYAVNGWGTASDGTPSSGTGSTPEGSVPYRNFLQDFLQKQQIKTVVDLGCGDWQIGRLIDWSGIDYLGLDAARSVIARNRANFTSPNIQFAWSTGENLPSADLLIIKDVLQHLPNHTIISILNQIGKFKYCLITNDCEPVLSINVDINYGAWRPLDLHKPPFNIPGSVVLRYVVPTGETKEIFLTKANHTSNITDEPANAPQ